MDKKTQISAIFLKEAKRQYYAGEITFGEYEEILTLIYEKLTDIENDFSKKEYVLKTFAIPGFNVNLLDTINFALAMN